MLKSPILNLELEINQDLEFTPDFTFKYLQIPLFYFRLPTKQRRFNGTNALLTLFDYCRMSF